MLSSDIDSEVVAHHKSVVPGPVVAEPEPTSSARRRITE